MIFYNKAIEQVNAITFPKYEPKFYDSFSLMQMRLEAGEVEMVSTYQNVADYVIANNDKYEVAKRSGKNLEVANIVSSARAAALSSGQIDVIFWVAVPDGDKFPADIDTPEGVELSAPYFKDSVAHLKLKDSK